jgi:hypothetical protein
MKPGRLLLMTLRSHNQYNTTIYDSGDRYRGIAGERRVIFLHPEDMRELGLTEKSTVLSCTTSPAAAPPHTIPKRTFWSASTNTPSKASPRCPNTSR